MNPEMMEALQALAADKGISVDTLFAALADALESAYKRMDGAYEYSWVTIDPDTMDIRVLAQELDEDARQVPAPGVVGQQVQALGVPGVYRQVQGPLMVRRNAMRDSLFETFTKRGRKV